MTDQMISYIVDALFYITGAIAGWQIRKATADPPKAFQPTQESWIELEKFKWTHEPWSKDAVIKECQEERKEGTHNE